MISANELSLAIANSWEQIAIELGSEVERFENELISLLRRLDSSQGKDREAVIRSILQLFQQHDAADRLLVQAIGKAASLGKGLDAPALFVKLERYTAVPVFYGTDRAAVAADDMSVRYGSERGDLTLGVARVSIPDDHRMGNIERPGLWKLQFREDPQRHVVVLSLEMLSPGEFAATGRRALNQNMKKEILLFVHGYNVGFNDAVSRAAQIAYDLKFEGLPAVYSWPSEGSAPKYTVDETNITWSRPRFVQFLNLLKEHLNAETVHIIAHSMGNRLVAETIASMTRESAASGARIRQIVFAAPDIDAATFKDLAAAFREKADGFTLYASSGDKALKASKAIHKYPRAGDAGPGLMVVDSVDTIDATAVDTSLMGHSYYGDNRSVLTDLFELIQRGSPPQDRFGLVAMKKYGARYWLFSP